jgi:hypothetical protein
VGQISCNKILAECERRKRLRRENPEWAAKEREQRRAQMKRSRERHGVALDEPRKIKMQVDPDYATRRRAMKATYNRASNKRCRARKNAEHAAWRAGRSQRTPVWSNLDAVKLVYLVAEQRTRLTGVAHHVDHFYPLNGKTVSGLHVPLNLRVIPATENLRKGTQLLLAA